MSHRIAKGFDFLAPFYDSLARLMLGKDIVNSQLHFIGSFKGCDRVLILGGGSGLFLDILCKECPDIKIDYVDISVKMICRARKRIRDCKSVNFIQGSEDDIPDRLYDGVITNFYLDMFNEKTLGKVIQKIKKSMTDSAHWMVTDFTNERSSHAFMLAIMYRFFRMIARIEATQLPDWQQAMICSGNKLLERKYFKNEFIISNLYLSSGLSSHNSNHQ